MVMRKWLVPILVFLALLSGCKKKAKTAPPPQAQAPTITQPQQPATTQQQPAETQQQQQPETQPTQPEPTETQPATTTPPPKPKPKPRHTANHKPATENKPVQQAANTPPAAVIAPTPAPPPLTPDVPHDQAELQRRSTEQLLETTEYNLRSVRRTLTDDEQQMVQQIRNYMQQARAAQNDGDVVRAKNLALKAHQLSDALVTP
jgi:outer membrane biosynthesis protein TonB